MKKILLVLCFIMLLAVPAFAVTNGDSSCAISVGTSTTTNARIPDSETVIVTLTCTADSGDGSYATKDIPLAGAASSLTAYNLYGYYLYEVGRKPGSPAIDASYTVTITDARAFAIDLGLLTSNGSHSAAQLNAIYSTAVSYPVVRSIPTVAITGNSTVSAKVILDLVFKAK